MNAQRKDLSPTKRERLIGFDLIRTWAYLAVITYHASWCLWPLDQPNPIPAPLSNVLLNVYSRPISFSGITLIFVTAFLLGLKDRLFARKWWLPLFLFLGWVAFSVVLAWHEHAPFQMTWDVYPLILVGAVSGSLLLRARSKRILWAVVISTGVALCIPFWRWEYSLPVSSYWTQVLVGLCPNAEWPLFPWVFLLWGGIASGRLYKLARLARPTEFFELRRGEWIACGGAVAALLYVMPRWYEVPGGPDFACFTLRQPWPTFWGYFGGLLALMRLSVAPSVQRWLSRQRLACTVSNLAMNRRFFASYFGHYLAAWLLSAGARSLGLLRHLWVYDVVMILIFVSADAIPRGVMYFGRLKASEK